MNVWRVMSRNERAIVNIFRVDVTSTVVLLPAYLMQPAAEAQGVRRTAPIGVAEALSEVAVRRAACRRKPRPRTLQPATAQRASSQRVGAHSGRAPHGTPRPKELCT